MNSQSDRNTNNRLKVTAVHDMYSVKVETLELCFENTDVSFFQSIEYSTSATTSQTDLHCAWLQGIHTNLFLEFQPLLDWTLALLISGHTPEGTEDV